MYWYYYVIIVVCLLFSAFFSAADMVYSSVDKLKLEKLASNSKNARMAIKLVEKYEFSVSSILFGNNLVNILASSLVTILGSMYAGSSGATIAPIIFTGILIVVAEFIPKAFAKRFSLELSLVFAYPVYFFCGLFFVFTWPISKLFQAFVNLFKKQSEEEEKIDENILDQMIDEVTEKGDLEEDEAEIVRGAVDLIDIEAFEIMTPRVDVFAIDIEDSVDELVNNKNILKYSRIPVYEGTIDNIIGILLIKEFSRKLLDKKKINIREMLVKPLIIPRNYQVTDLLGDFKKSNIHIAIIKDEYGGVDGIVTMEDILEEVVGDIFDENDDYREEVVEKRKNNYIIDGMMNIDDFFELINYKEDFDTAYSTVGGFCQEFVDGFAKVGDSFKFGGYNITVIEAEPYSVSKVQVVKLHKKGTN